MRVKSGHLAIALVCLVLGFLVSMQYRVQRLSEHVTSNRDPEMAVQLKAVEEARNKLQDEVARLRKQVTDIGQQQSAYKALGQELEHVQMLAGFTAVHGPGVTVVMDDSRAPLKPGENPNLQIIHDVDILQVVNELRASGAEAVAINGQRLVADTEIRCVGPTVVINGTRTAPPLRIQAVGNPDVLESGINLRGGIKDALATYGIQVSVKKEKDLPLPAFKGSSDFKFAEIVKGGA